MSITARCHLARTFENIRFFILSVLWYWPLSLLGFGYYTGLKYDHHVGILEHIDEIDNVHQYCQEHGITEEEYYKRVKDGHVLLSTGKPSTWSSDISHEMIARWGVDVESIMMDAIGKEVEEELKKEMAHGKANLCSRLHS